jgi:formiminotetrahydrofolate cyclodeaminase
MDSAFLKALAQARPDPGGGAGAAHCAALGLALLSKVVQLEHRRQGPEGEPGLPWSDLLARARLVAAALLRLQEEDVQKLTSSSPGPEPKATPLRWPRPSRRRWPAR